MNKNQKTELKQLPEEEIKNSAESLLDQKIHLIEKLKGGRNSQIYFISGKEKYVVKFYFCDPLDLRNRLQTEYYSLQLLWENGIRSIPQPIAQDSAKNLGIYSFVEGEKINPEDISEKELDAAIFFLKEINKLQLKANKMPFAADACFCIKDYISIIKRRLSDLSKILESTFLDKELHLFLREEFRPALQRIVLTTKALLQKEGLSVESRIKRDDTIISPSDFGFHNALRDKEGNIIFLDFEYFGWDDCAKTVSDFLLHPGMYLNEKHKKYFARNITNSLNNTTMKARVKMVYPLVGLIWCLILLNEFVPKHQARRDFAFNKKKDSNEHFDKRIQLEKTKGLLKQIKEYKITYWD